MERGISMSKVFFDNVKRNFGFGCMRLPMNGEQVDYEETCRMVDTFLENGFNYFDKDICKHVICFNDFLKILSR